jgi:hypothetical protein
MMWLEEEKRAKLLTTLKGWIMSGLNERGIPFSEFESVTAKLRHAFLAVECGKGLLSPCNRLLCKRPEVEYLHRNAPLFSAIKDMRTILRESTTRPTRCNELVAGWPDYVGICDASSFGAGGRLPPNGFSIVMASGHHRICWGTARGRSPFQAHLSSDYS